MVGLDGTARPTAARMVNANGTALTTTNAHSIDPITNYEPTILPRLTGGYAWMVFTSRRIFGNVATVNPYWSDPRFQNLTVEPTTKKLWVAAVNVNAAGTDPSFARPSTFPGQELLAGNSRGYYVLNACEAPGLPPPAPAAAISIAAALPPPPAASSTPARRPTPRPSTASRCPPPRPAPPTAPAARSSAAAARSPARSASATSARRPPPLVSYSTAGASPATTSELPADSYCGATGSTSPGSRTPRSTRPSCSLPRRPRRRQDS